MTPSVRNSLKFFLEIENFTVRVYRSGDELLTDADHLPRCGRLVIDYKMPEMNGLELLEKLRYRRISLPAIMITSSRTSAPARASCRRRRSHCREAIFGEHVIGEDLRRFRTTIIAELRSPKPEYHVEKVRIPGKTEWHLNSALVRKQTAAPGLHEEVARHASKNPFLHPAMTVGACHNQVGGILR